MKKTLALMAVVGLIVLVLSGCGVDADPARALTADTASGFWETFFILPLVQFITWLYYLIGNLGVAIIIASLLVKIAIMPLMVKSMNSTAKMQSVSPQLDKIKQKYAGKTDQDSRMKMNMEMQSLYKENGINPLAGCWPMLIQMPLMMAFFQAFSRHPYIATETPRYFLGMSLAISGELPNVILAIVVSGLMYLSQSLTQKRIAANNQNANANPAMNPKMMSLMMLPVFALMVYGSPLAMGLYFLVTQIVMLIQPFIIKRPAVA